MVWELWDTDSGNIINTYPTEQAALAVVRAAVNRHGRSYVAVWALGRGDAAAGAGGVMAGDALVDRAMTVLSA